MYCILANQYTERMDEISQTLIKFLGVLTPLGLSIMCNYIVNAISKTQITTKTTAITIKAPGRTPNILLPEFSYLMASIRIFAGICAIFFAATDIFLIPIQTDDYILFILALSSLLIAPFFLIRTAYALIRDRKIQNQPRNTTPPNSIQPEKAIEVLQLTWDILDRTAHE